MAYIRIVKVVGSHGGVKGSGCYGYCRAQLEFLKRYNYRKIISHNLGSSSEMSDSNIGNMKKIHDACWVCF